MFSGPVDLQLTGCRLKVEKVLREVPGEPSP
jgi:hypothetical protein